MYLSYVGCQDYRYRKRQMAAAFPRAEQKKYLKEYPDIRYTLIEKYGRDRETKTYIYRQSIFYSGTLLKDWQIVLTIIDTSEGADSGVINQPLSFYQKL